MQPYLVCRDVHLCVTDDCIVLLHLVRDQYIALHATQSNRLVGHVAGWPKFECASSRCSEPSCERPPEQLLAELLSAGIITADPALGHEASAVALDRPGSVLCVWTFGAKPRFHFTEVARLALACGVAAFVLNSLPLNAVVRRVSRRKARRAAAYTDLKRARELTATFLDWRSLFYTPRRKCQLDSLTLIEFLALSDVFPEWVFGVQTGPFAAHCWVQIGSTTCNDTPDNVRRYTPILVI